MFNKEKLQNIRFPLTIKIALSLILIIFIVMGVSTFLDIKDNRNDMENYEKKNNISAFTSALPIMENALWEIDFKTINSTLNQMMKNPNVISVSLFSETGYSISYVEKGSKKELLNLNLEDFISNENKDKLFKMEFNNKNTIILQIKDDKNETFTLAYPLFFKNTKKSNLLNVKVGYLIMVYSTHHIAIANNEIFYKSVILSTLLGLVIILTSFLVIRKVIINPIKELEKASIEIAKNNFIQTPLKKGYFGNDEIESLKINFNFMVRQIIQLIKDEKEQQRMANELETTKIIQKSFIPKAKNLRVGFFELSGFFQSASECGGDWWHFYPLSEKRIMIMLGDVTGHGTPSAMLTAAVKGYCDSIYARKSLDTSKILEELDVVVRSIGGDERMMTMFVAIIDPIKQKLTYSNAAQNFPFVIDQNSNTTSPITLLGNGKRLGYLSPISHRKVNLFKIHSIDFKINNILFLYSDGLTEAKNTGKREYSDRRLIKKLKSLQNNDTSEIIKMINMDLIEFTQGEPLEDDVTFVAFRLCETENKEYSTEIIDYFDSQKDENANTPVDQVS
ncbi:MAG: SpoIIE family protein phosphatase [Silvanigrellaceae bacterium]|nr:SpoIIE family protein phosphatase [Silvanigrellaceae bacterium]